MNNNKPKVSLITTCRNRANTIENTILSVLGQDYPNIEYIIIDGLSKDGSVEIIRKYQDKIAEFVSEPDGGVYNAINKGIKLATGDIIGLIHSDDKLYETSTISRVVEMFNYSDADLVYANGVYSTVKGTIRRVWYSGQYERGKVQYGWLPLHTTVYVKRNALMKYGLYNENYKISSDTDFLIRYLFENDLKIGFMDRVVVDMRMGGLSTSPKYAFCKWREDFKIFRLHGFNPIFLVVFKVFRKVPQFIKAFKY